MKFIWITFYHWIVIHKDQQELCGSEDFNERQSDKPTILNKTIKQTILPL